MTHKPPRRPGRLSMPWVTSDARVGQAPVRARLVSLLLRPTTRSLTVGIVVAAMLIAAETLLVYLLTQVAPGMAFGVIYLLGVLVISTGWGFGLAVTMSVASALAFDYLHVQPGGIVPDSAADVVVITMFVVVALAANTLAGVAAARARPGWTAMRMLQVPSPHGCVIWAFARRWVRPLSSTAGCGGRPSSARRDPNPCPPTPRRGSSTSPTSSRPRSPTPRPTRNLPRLGPGSWRQPMMRGGVWNAI